MAPNRAPQGEIPDALHLLFLLQPAQVDLRRLRLAMPQEPLQRVQFARMRLQELDREGCAEGVGSGLDAGTLAPGSLHSVR